VRAESFVLAPTLGVEPRRADRLVVIDPVQLLAAHAECDDCIWRDNAVVTNARATLGSQIHPKTGRVVAGAERMNPYLVELSRKVGFALAQQRLPQIAS